MWRMIKMLKIINPFTIAVYWGRGNIHLRVKQLSYGIGAERFEVRARNGILIYESNRPILRRKGLNKWIPEIKLSEGKLMHESLEREIGKAIIKYVMELEGK